MYGQWPKQSKNIKPFFTASFSEKDIEKVKPKEFTGTLNMVFLGSLVPGKQPLEAIKLVEALHKNGLPVRLHLYGDGVLKEALQQYIQLKQLEKIVTLKGNQPKSAIIAALNEAHFSVLPSKSEGWPKAIAEAMFFGCVPIATSVSCVPDMLDYGNRGYLLTDDLSVDIENLTALLQDSATLKNMSEAAAAWSQQYTLECFETEIAKLLQRPE